MNPGSKLQKIQKFSKYLNQNQSKKFIGGYGYNKGKGHKNYKVQLDVKLEQSTKMKMQEVPYFEQQMVETENDEQYIMPNNMVKVLYPKRE